MTEKEVEEVDDEGMEDPGRGEGGGGTSGGNGGDVPLLNRVPVVSLEQQLLL